MDTLVHQSVQRDNGHLTLYLVVTVTDVDYIAFRRITVVPRIALDTRSQNDVAICLEVFNCVSAEQTIAMRKATFSREKEILATCSVRHLLLKPQKNWRPYKVLLYLSSYCTSVLYCCSYLQSCIGKLQINISPLPSGLD